MNERQTDFEWVQQFARAGNQTAFRSLVQRHIDLVFATALHKIGDPGGAEEISQNVFGVLARKAWRFAPDDSLPAWLHKTTLLESKSWLRGEMRRRRREQTAAELGTTMKTPEDQPAFNALVPLLDEALLSLREKDRAALLLRFYEKQSMRNLGSALGVTEDAAQKRVQTALERLSQFFRRRGYKTASVATAAAALQHTAASASAATISLIANAALQTTPPVLAGLFVWLSRMASLSKVQTATVCLVVAAAPVLWQWHQRQAANTQLKQAETSLTASRSERDSLQTELQELREQSSRLKTTLADTTKTAAQREDEAKRFADWKKHIRSQLLSDDYQWPEDSPFVRIPKKLVPQLNIGSPVLQSGVIKQEARELLGLTPQERERAEAALHEYFSKMNHLISSSLYETNRPTFVFVPGNAIASQVFEIPALGDTVKQYADELESVLHQDLGDERWQLVKDELESYSSGGLRQMLNLDASDRAQELAVWIQEQNGQLKAGYAWGDHTGRSSSSGLVLSNFLPNAVFAPGINTVEDYMGIHQYSTQLTEPALAWLRQQAETRLENQPTNRGGQ